MSNTAANPFSQLHVSKFMDVVNMMGCLNCETVMTAHRRNVEAITAYNQAASEAIQALTRHQADLCHRGFEEYTNIMKAITSSATPEAKLIRHAEASTNAVEKCMATACEIAEAVANCNYRSMETVSNRMNNAIEELRTMIKTTQAVA